VLFFRTSILRPNQGLFLNVSTILPVVGIWYNEVKSMKKHEIHLEDWQRILFGQAPPIFLLEVLIRTFIIYVFLLFTLRWLGKRMNGQLTILELSIMLTLGAIVSVAMQVPDRGITLSMFVLFCTLAVHRLVSWLGVKSARIEELSFGKMSLLVKDGVLQLDEMSKCRISNQQLFAELRSNGIFNLGKVQRVYLEACGLFSIIQSKSDIPGLPILPPDDRSALHLLQRHDQMACCNCGRMADQGNTSTVCPNCGNEEWTQTATS
jgi:uncharacterized membrane protein YcaP (DUF421 family)